MHRPSHALLALLLIVAIAACSQPADTPGSSDVPANTPSVEASETGQASVAPGPSESGPATIGADVELATVLPASVAGQQMTVQSGSGEESAGTLPLAIAGGVAESLEVASADMAWASASAPNADTSGNHVLWAVRFPGAGTEQLVETVTSGLGGIGLAAGMIDVTDETVGGKDVSVLPTSAQADTAYYIYAVGDVVFVLTTDDPAEADDAMAQLP
jgi:hypothetical protein